MKVPELMFAKRHFKQVKYTYIPCFYTFAISNNHLYNNGLTLSRHVQQNSSVCNLNSNRNVINSVKRNNTKFISIPPVNMY